MSQTGRRLGASLVDLVVLLGAYPLLEGLARIVFFEHPYQWALLSLEAVLLTTVYHCGLECSPMRGSLGKHIFGLQVVDREQKPLSRGRALVHHILRLFTLPFGWVGLWMGTRDQALHDLLSGTRVLVPSSVPAQAPEPPPPTVKCPSCSWAATPGSNFCQQCGTALKPPRVKL